LEELNISWCEQITDLGLFYIAKNCNNLKTLFCKGLENVCYLLLKNIFFYFFKDNLKLFCKFRNGRIEKIKFAFLPCKTFTFKINL